MSQRKKTALVGGVAILSVAGILSKIIGMFFRIPLAKMIGSDGMGIYQVVYPTYTMLLTISTAGIPVAISRLVSESVAQSRHREARAILRVAVALLAIIGVALTLVLVALSGPLAKHNGDAGIAIGYIAIAPSILLVSVMSALRGYLQGHSRMAPTAISQLIEQLAKVAISFPLAMLGMQTSVVNAAAGALLGITCGEALALLFMYITYARSRREYGALEAADTAEPEPAKKLIRTMVSIAIPITIGSMIVPVSGFIDSILVIPRLMGIGFEASWARSLYGLLSGFVLPLINVPTALATAVCMSLVPAISAARIAGRDDEMHETSRMGLRLSSLIGFPCAVGMSMLSTEIIRMLFSELPPDQVAIAGALLSISAWTILLFTHVQGSTGILQGAGMHKVPMYSLLVGVICKISLNFILIGIPSINIYGAPFSSLVCYGLSMAINIIWIIRKTGMRFDWGGIVVRPGLATAGMAAAVFLCRQVLDMSMRRSTIIAVAAGVLVYVVLIFLVGALRREDVDQIPGGAKIEKLMLKLRIWR